MVGKGSSGRTGIMVISMTDSVSQEFMSFQSRRPALALLCLLAFSGSALADNHAAGDPRDPWEGYNRAAYGFNKGFDSIFLRPAAEAYDAIAPEAVDRGVTNFFSNLGDIRNFFNNFLQGKPDEATDSLARLVINSTVGLLGFIDVATEIGIHKSEEDFGQTLGAGGAEPGPYFVIPFLGPSTVRDAIGKPVDFAMSPLTWAGDGEFRAAVFAAQAVDYRADLLDTEEAVEGIAEDEYTLVRNAYLDQRQFEVSDGAVTDAYELEE